MRQIPVESARRKQARRHGRGQQRLEGFDLQELPLPIEAEEVKLRCFVGLNHDEIAQVLGVSEKTVKRYWAYAKVWLYQHIQP